MSITIDREGAKALFDIIDADPGRPAGVLRALRRAADGDFADFADLAAPSTEPCTKSCDHGSRCVMDANHSPHDRHESEHGCIFYDDRDYRCPEHTTKSADGAEG